MSNLNKSAHNSVRLINNKLLKQLPNFIEKYYLLIELLVTEYQLQNISITNMALDK